MYKEITESFGSIFRRTDSIFRKRCKDPFVSKGLANYIFVICDNEGIIADEISNFLSVDKGTTARALAKLEQHQYIRRVQDREDKRKFKIFSLEKSRILYKDLLETSYSIGEEVLNVLSESEKEQLLLLTRKIRTHAREIDSKEEL